MINIDKKEIQLLWDSYLVGGFLKGAPLEIVLNQFWSELTAGKRRADDELSRISNRLDRYPPARYISFKSKLLIGVFVSTHMKELNNWLYRMMDKKKDIGWIINQVNNSGIKTVEPTESRSVRLKIQAKRADSQREKQTIIFSQHTGHRRRDWHICK